MNIEEVREYALSLNEQVTEDLFVKSWISWRIAGKWFLLTNLDVPEPHVAVKMQPDVAIELRERYEGVGPAIHMNKKNWSELYLNQLNDDFVKQQIKASYDLVVSKLPKKLRPTSIWRSLMCGHLPISTVTSSGMAGRYFWLLMTIREKSLVVVL